MVEAPHREPWAYGATYTNPNGNTAGVSELSAIKSELRYENHLGPPMTIGLGLYATFPFRAHSVLSVK